MTSSLVTGQPPAASRLASLADRMVAPLNDYDNSSTDVARTRRQDTLGGEVAAHDTKDAICQLLLERSPGEVPSPAVLCAGGQ